MDRLLVHSDINQHSMYYKRTLISFARYFPFALVIAAKLCQILLITTDSKKICLLIINRAIIN